MRESAERLSLNKNKLQTNTHRMSFPSLDSIFHSSFVAPFSIHFLFALRAIDVLRFHINSLDDGVKILLPQLFPLIFMIIFAVHEIATRSTAVRHGESAESEQNGSRAMFARRETMLSRLKTEILLPAIKRALEHVVLTMVASVVASSGRIRSEGARVMTVRHALIDSRWKMNIFRSKCAVQRG